MILIRIVYREWASLRSIKRFAILCGVSDCGSLYPPIKCFKCSFEQKQIERQRLLDCGEYRFYTVVLLLIISSSIATRKEKNQNGTDIHWTRKIADGVLSMSPSCLLLSPHATSFYLIPFQYRSALNWAVVWWLVWHQLREGIVDIVSPMSLLWAFIRLMFSDLCTYRLRYDKWNGSANISVVNIISSYPHERFFVVFLFFVANKS